MAGRKATPWFWQARGIWAVIINGKRTPLHKEEAEAYRRFAELMEENALTGDASSVRAVLNAYLAHLKAHASASAHRVATWAVKALPPPLLRLEAHALTPKSVSKWISGKAWAEATKNSVLGVFLSAYNFAVKEGNVKSNALKGIAVPAMRSRGEEAIVSPEAYASFLEACTDDGFKDIVIALHMTGCRPGEACKVKATDFNAEAGTWTLAEHKTAKKTGKKRVIVLPTPLVTMCQRLALARPTGTLFRNKRGTSWTPCALARRFSIASKRASVKVFPYAFRHTFATDRLLSGMTGDMVAALLGNSPAMLHKHYSHLLQDVQRLRNALLKSIGE